MYRDYPELEGTHKISLSHLARIHLTEKDQK